MCLLGCWEESQWIFDSISVEDKADVTWDMVWSITQAVLSISFSVSAKVIWWSHHLDLWPGILKSLEKSWDLACIHQNRTVYFIMMMLISTVFSWKQLNCYLFLSVGLFDEFNNCLWLKYYLWRLLLTRSMFLYKNHACRPINLKPQVLRGHDTGWLFITHSEHYKNSRTWAHFQHILSNITIEHILNT